MVIFRVLLNKIDTLNISYFDQREKRVGEVEKLLFFVKKILKISLYKK